jgi:hypothetical protein
MIVPGYEGLVQSLYNSKNLIVESGTRCNLLCPGCARYHLFTNGIKLTPLDLSLDYFKLAVNDEYQIDDIYWSNVYSDVIYSATFIDILEYQNTLQHRPTNRISTNGSGRSVDWWKRLATSLDDKDIWEFSIDGLEDTNHIYRVNSKWDTIMLGASTLINELEILGKKTHVNWRFILFEHNHNQLLKAYKLAKAMKFTNFKYLLGNMRTPEHMVLKSKTFEEAEAPLKAYANKSNIPNQEYTNSADT